VTVAARRLGREWWAAPGLAIGLRAVLTTVGAVSVATAHRLRVRGQWADLILPGRSFGARALAVWQRWDGLWYQRIAQQGYRPNDGSTAFFTFYPLATRALAWLLGGRFVVAELLLSSAAFTVAMVLLHRLVRIERERVPRATAPPPQRGRKRARAAPGTTLAPDASVVADLCVWLVALWPVAFFFHAPYTESLFLALTLGALLSARLGHTWRAGLLGLLAATARTQGVLLTLPLGWELIRQSRAARRAWLPALLAAALPLAGVAVVVGYFRAVLGAGGLALGAQALWGYTVVPPWEPVLASVLHIVFGGDPARGSYAWVEAINLVSLLGFTVMAIAGLRRVPALYSLYVLPALAVLYTRDMSFSPLMSVSRFTLVLFPCFMLAATWLARHRAFALAWLVTAGIAQLALFAYWTRWHFVA